MKVSLNWLKDYVNIQMEVKDLAHLLTMAGLEVEGVHSVGEGLERVIVAEIVSVRKHPNADRLTLVEAKTGRGRRIYKITKRGEVFLKVGSKTLQGTLKRLRIR